MLDRPLEYDKMARVERDLWWYRILHAIVVDALRRHTAGQEADILDAGCGTGGLMLSLRAHGYSRVSGFDLSEDALRICRERGLSAVQENLVNIARRYPPQSFDAVVSNDALYFLEDDERFEFIRGARQVLRPGGLLILNVPAFKAFRGIHDVSVGIRSRFSRTDVARLFEDSGFRVVRRVFWPFLLSPVILLIRFNQRRRMRRRPDFDVASDVEVPPRWLNGLLYGLTRFETRCLPFGPFGSSMFVVAQSRRSPKP